MSLQGVGRTAAVLLAFTSGEAVLGVSEVARRVELPKSAVHRIMDSLAGSGLLARDESGTRYQLGPRASELAIAAFGSRNVPALALPVMEELAQQSAETTTLSLLVGRERVYAQQVESAQDVRMTVEVGRRYPLYAGASGRAILAFLPAAERDSYLESTVLQKLTEATVTEVGPFASGSRRSVAWASP